MNKQSSTLQQILNNAVDNKKVFGASFCVKYKGETWCGASGNFSTDDQYFIASTTKLFVTAIILQFKHKGLLDIEDKIAKYLEESVLHNLHMVKGKSYAQDISIKHLLAHTSGIPDYFQQKNAAGESLEKAILHGNDQPWTFDQAVELSKTLAPPFIPNAKGKAHYSDTNFQLLGKIIENVSDQSIADNLRELIFEPLILSKTYLFGDIEDTRPKTLYYKDKPLIIPKAMASFGPDGGIVSTSKELLIFLEAFFNGVFFPKAYLGSLQVWNRIFFPMQSGIGIHRFKLPWIFNPFGTFPELIGHSGLSGTLAYHSPEKELYIAGTVNQIAYPDSSFRLAIKLIQQAMKG